jgi:hypothetical protein
MAQIIAFISIFVLGAIIFLLILGRLSSLLDRLLLVVYGYNLATEAIMFATSKMRINNHIIANIHTLFFGIGMLIICSQIWQGLYKQKASLKLISVITLFYLLTWITDNLVLHSITVFNPVSQSVIFGINLILTIYILSLIMFLVDSPFKKRVESFLVIGCLLYAANNVIVDFFFNYSLHWSDATYLLISEIGICVTLISHSCIFLGVLCMVLKKRPSYHSTFKL